MSMHRMRTELEDLKHDLNTSDIELHILEGKILDQEESLTTMKQLINESQAGKLDDLQKLISTLNKKFSSLEKKQDEILSDIRQLGSHANETTTALSQYKDKICEMEKSILFQNKKFEELAKLKRNLGEIIQETAKSSTREFDSYTIKEGDSLKRISRNFSVSVEELKKVNKLKDDLIMTGQEILIPKNIH
ncbi:MAG: hypothetical protein S4CHLAM37_01230 [Chlamydiia bacterium]|nr:hypothetical protein [Chlamydiia bacterium]